MRIVCAAALAACLLWPLPGWSQSPVASAASRPKAAPPSVSHVLSKTVTQTAGDAAVFMTVFSIGTGSLPAATVLTAGTMLIGTVVYPTNEYLWEYFSPNTNLSANSKAFDTSASLWRTTYKYLSFKATVLTSKFAWLYLYTGSVVSTATMGTATSLALPAIFYINSTAWDWYDWRTAPTVPVRSTASR